MPSISNSTWTEVACRVPPEALEAAAEILRQLSPGGLVVEGSATLKIYVPAGRTGVPSLVEARLAGLAAHFPGMDGVSVSTRAVEEEDWACAWKAYFRPLEVGRKLLVVPAWEDPPVGSEHRIPLRVDPGMAFGTGSHETTRLCLEELEQVVTPVARVLDLGTGSGILAIACALLGAGRIWAVDPDPVAVRAAGGNLALNGVTAQVRLIQGELDDLAGESFDLAVANLNSRLLVSLSQGLAARLRRPGSLIVSGVLAAEADRVETALTAAGLVLQGRRTMGEWAVLRLAAPAGRGEADHAQDFR